MNTVIDVLRTAKAELADPNRWCSRGWGTKGGETQYMRDDADTVCLFRAVQMAAKRCGVDLEPALVALRAVAPNGSIMCFNDRDSTTHADIIDALDRAILAEADKHVHEFNPHTHICPCGETANGRPVDYEALAPLADAVAAVIGE